MRQKPRDHHYCEREFLQTLRPWPSDKNKKGHETDGYKTQMPPYSFTTNLGIDYGWKYSDQGDVINAML